MAPDGVLGDIRVDFPSEEEPFIEELVESIEFRGRLAPSASSGRQCCARPHLAQPELESFPQWEALNPQPLPHGSQGGLFNQP